MRSLFVSAQLSGAFDVVAAAQDTTEAIDLAVRHRPDAALIDVNMPGGGGLEAVRRITADCPGICLVILSGDEEHEHVVELLNAGAVAYVRKGATGAEIADTIARSIQARTTDR